MKLINRILLLLAILGVVSLAVPTTNIKNVIIYGLLGIGPLVILFILDFFWPVFKIKILLIIWRLISSVFALATILSVIIANGENCNYACGYPILYVTMANWIFAGVALLLIIIQFVRNRKRI